jgi:hypothetical protein
MRACDDSDGARVGSSHRFALARYARGSIDNLFTALPRQLLTAAGWGGPKEGFFEGSDF